MIDLNQFRLLGRQAAENRAAKLNFANANSAGAEFTASPIERACKYNDCGHLQKAIMEIQMRSSVSLWQLIDLAADDQLTACNAFIAGCWEWLDENPD
jgi:hypothetical protein